MAAPSTWKMAVSKAWGIMRWGDGQMVVYRDGNLGDGVGNLCFKPRIPPFFRITLSS